MFSHILDFRSIAALFLLELILLGGCSNPKSTPSANANPQKSEQTEGQTLPEKSTEKSKTDTSKNNSFPSPSTSDGEQLYGRWSPISYVAPDGKGMDLSQFSESERSALSWEFTTDGIVKFADRKGRFTLEGKKLKVENINTGNIAEYEFSLSGTELTIVNEDGATFKLTKAKS